VSPDVVCRCVFLGEERVTDARVTGVAACCAGVVELGAVVGAVCVATVAAGVVTETVAAGFAAGVAVAVACADAPVAGATDA
jgi:hypothetical protein